MKTNTATMVNKLNMTQYIENKHNISFGFPTKSLNVTKGKLKIPTQLLLK
jgi:hypothetical protein